MVATVDKARNQALLGWYAANSRDFPWRGTTDPYRIMISEVMLQQTQAGRVVPYYESFLSRFPTVEVLADAPLGEVLSAWSGLGYNNRARRLRDAARLIAADGWPEDVEALEALPGIGAYTAAAISAFAFGKPVVAVDTNLRRVLSRWNGEPLAGEALTRAAETALGHPAATWNQAVMDLGSTLCLPRGARCDRCPVTDWCSGPDGYQPPVPQPRFEGSVRQLRGAIVRAVVASPVVVEELAGRTGFSESAVGAAVEELIDDGLLEIDDETGMVSVAG